MKPVADEGQLALLSNRKENMAAMFLDRVAATPSREAFRYPSGDQWKSVSWRDLDELARRRAAGLIALGVQPEQRVAIASSTRMEWVECYLAAVLAAAATTTIYPSTMATDVAFIVSDADVQVVFAEDASQLDKLREHRSETPSLQKVVLLDGEPPAGGSGGVDQRAQVIGLDLGKPVVHTGRVVLQVRRPELVERRQRQHPGGVVGRRLPVEQHDLLQ
jgi:long-chain acyl-CoA synthetase